MFAVAGDGAGIADGGGDIVIRRICGRWVAVETGVEALLERPEVARACVELLVDVSEVDGQVDRKLTYGKASRASASRLSCSLMKLLV